MTDAERDAVAIKPQRYTGLPAQQEANLRVSEVAFTHEWLRSQGHTVAPALDPLHKIGAAFTAAFLNDLHVSAECRPPQDLPGRPHTRTNSAFGDTWKWTYSPIGAKGEPMVNSGVDLANALVQDLKLKVQVPQGYEDLATPFFATEQMSHLGVPHSASERTEMKHYEAGPMRVLNPPSLRTLIRTSTAGTDAFIHATVRH